MLRRLGFSSRGWEVIRGFWGGQSLTTFTLYEDGPGEYCSSSFFLGGRGWCSSSLWNFLALALRSHVFQRGSMSSHCSLRHSRATRTFCCYWVILNSVISTRKCFLRPKIFTHWKKMLYEGKPPPPLRNVMRKVEHFQLTTFYRLWISKYRAKEERTNKGFTEEIFV